MKQIGTSVGQRVGYSVRFERHTSPETRITFATDGVVVRQAVQSPLLPMYDVLVLDEAHERSLSTDVLLALAKRALQERRRRKAAGAAQ